MGDFHLNPAQIQSYKIAIKTNESGAPNVYFTITTAQKEITFRVWDDDRWPNLDQIKNFIEKGLEAAMLEGDFFLSEYVERLYIFIWYTGADQRQFSGERVS